LKALQEQRLSTKVLMFSTYTTVGAQQTFEALELGAIDFVPKPSNTGFSKGFEQVHEELLSKIKFIGSARSPQAISSLRRSPRLTSPPVAAAGDYEVIVFEGGMGAPKTFMNIIPELPADQTPGVVLFQAMFSGFAEQFVRRLDRNAQISVKAAENNDPVQSGKGLVLFGDYYASVKRSAGKTLQLAFREKDDTEKYGTVPRLLFESVARTCGSKAIGVILAGAGEANLDGIQAMKDHGALIITEETTSNM
jgi:two-component system chemotaxis response regulator CheB